MDTSIDARRNITIWVAVRALTEKANPNHNPISMGKKRADSFSRSKADGAAIEIPSNPRVEKRTNSRTAVAIRIHRPNNFFV
jgi:hypothetical protein